MKRLSEQQVNDRIRRAADALTPKRAEEIWNMPIEKADSSAWFLTEGEQKPVKPLLSYRKWASLAAACLVIVFLGWFQLYGTPDVTVYLDVNPSVSIEVNRMGRVTAVKAENEDGRIILDNMDLKHTDIDVAMNALLGSMVKHGYLSESQNTILISVNGKDETRTETLRQRVATDAEDTLKSLLGSSIILEQTLDLDDAIEDVAEEYGITPGKAALILRLLQDEPEWDVATLAGEPMADLIRDCQAAGIDIAQYLGNHGEIIGNLEQLRDDDDDDDADDDDEREAPDDNDTDREEEREDPEELTGEDVDDKDDPEDDNDNDREEPDDQDEPDDSDESVGEGEDDWDKPADDPEDDVLEIENHEADDRDENGEDTIDDELDQDDLDDDEEPDSDEEDEAEDDADDLDEEDDD